MWLLITILSFSPAAEPVSFAREFPNRLTCETAVKQVIKKHGKSVVNVGCCRMSRKPFTEDEKRINALFDLPKTKSVDDLACASEELMKTGEEARKIYKNLNILK